MPKFLIGDKHFLEDVIKLGMKLSDKLQNISDGNRSTESNPQILFRALKMKVKELGVKRAREAIPKTVRGSHNIKTVGGVGFIGIQKLSWDRQLKRSRE